MSVVLPVATSAAQTEHINDRAILTHQMAGETGVDSFGAAHPDKPAFVIDDLLILHPDHAVKCCAVQEVLHRLNNPNLHYIHGDGLLPSVDCLSADLTHPTVEGHRAMAEQLLRIIRAHWRG